MPKQLLNLNSLGVGTISTLTTGTYGLGSISINSAGQIISLGGGVATSNVSGIVGSLNRIVTSGTNNISINLSSGIFSSGTVLIPSIINIDNYGRVTGATTSSGALQGTFAGYIGTASVNAAGYITSLSVLTQTTSTLSASNSIFTSTTFSNSLTIYGSIVEPFQTITGATGIVTHDFSKGNQWKHTAIAGNFTANFTNVPTTAGYIINTSLILVQGISPFLPTAIQINGISQTVKYPAAITPSGTANRTEIMSYTFINTNTSWLVLAGLASYA